MVDTRVTDAGLKELAPLTQLQSWSWAMTGSEYQIEERRNCARRYPAAKFINSFATAPRWFPVNAMPGGL